MNIELLHQPDSAIAHIFLEADEELIAEAGSMIAMSGYINASTTLRHGKGGGIIGGIKRMLAKESLFLSVFRSPTAGGEIFLAPPLMGDICTYQITGNDLIVQAGSFLASASGVTIDLGFQGFKSFFSGEAIFWLTLSGYGQVLLSSFGGIYEVPVNGEYVVDTGHVVAFESSLDFQVTKSGSSWLGAWLSKEGLVLKFKGQGKVYCQTHNSSSFGSLVGTLLPPIK